MRRFFISSGDFDEIIEAKDPDAALDSAVKRWALEEEPVQLGKIIRIVEVTPWADVEYIKTEHVLFRASIRRLPKR